MLAPRALFNQGRLVLDVVIRGFDAAGIELPERRHVAPGQTAPADDEQLVVHLLSSAAGHPGQPTAQWQRSPASFRSATWQVSILRAVHTQGTDSALAPGPIEVEADAEIAFTDVAVLQNLMETAKLQKILAGPGVPITISPVIPIGPEGGLAGVQVQVSIALEGEPSR